MVFPSRMKGLVDTRTSQFTDTNIIKSTILISDKQSQVK